MVHLALIQQLEAMVVLVVAVEQVHQVRQVDQVIHLLQILLKDKMGELVPQMLTQELEEAVVLVLQEQLEVETQVQEFQLEAMVVLV